MEVAEEMSKQIVVHVEKDGTVQVDPDTVPEAFHVSVFDLREEQAA